jgi:hypothetical protein
MLTPLHLAEKWQDYWDEVKYYSGRYRCCHSKAKLLTEEIIDN